MSSELSAHSPLGAVPQDRWTIVLASVIVIIQFFTLPVVFGMADERRTETVEEERADEPDVAAQRFSGAGPERTDTFPVEGGLTEFEIKHSGDSTFFAILEDVNFERVTGLVNTVGDFRGSTARRLHPGEYVLAMNGRDWSVTVTQPRYNKGETPPVSFSGENFSVTEPFQIKAEVHDEPGGPGETHREGKGTATEDGHAPSALRTVRFAITHEGEGKVFIRLLNPEGRRVTGVLDDQGSVETVEKTQLFPGLYLLDVQAEGEWTIAVEVQ